MEPIFRPIAFVKNVRREAIDDDWDTITSLVELADDVPSVAIKGLETFSHVELICYADLAEDVPPAPWHRHPRGNPEWPDIGIFANRNKDRPNRLLVSIARIERVDERSLVLTGLDAIDDTPVLDIKPVFSWNGPRGTTRFPAWSEELGKNYF